MNLIISKLHIHNNKFNVLEWINKNQNYFQEFTHLLMNLQTLNYTLYIHYKFINFSFINSIYILYMTPHFHRKNFKLRG